MRSELLILLCTNIFVWLQRITKVKVLKKIIRIHIKIPWISLKENRVCKFQLTHWKMKWKTQLKSRQKKRKSNRNVWINKGIEMVLNKSKYIRNYNNVNWLNTLYKRKWLLDWQKLNYTPVTSDASKVY